MNFPPDNALFHALYWLINTPGLGGLAVAGMTIICLGGIGAALRWILQGGEAQGAATYAYPTPALHHQRNGAGRASMNPPNPRAQEVRE